jgi:hypothetical protein
VEIVAVQKSVQSSVQSFVQKMAAMQKWVAEMNCRNRAEAVAERFADVCAVAVQNLVQNSVQ